MKKSDEESNTPAGDALLPCPFCGSVEAHLTQNKSDEDERHWNWYVTHLCGWGGLGMDTRTKDGTREAAIAAWNRRASVTLSEKALPMPSRERLREQIAADPDIEASTCAPSAGGAISEDARELIAKLRDEGNSIKSVHMIRGADLSVWYALMRRAAEFIERTSTPSAKGECRNGDDS